MDLNQDNLVAQNDLSVSVPAFEGPLDLLLFLIRRNEIDIYDIPVSTITEQYLATLRGMERQQLDVAGDFFVMAATLMYLKSRMLLPKEKQTEEAAAGTDEEIDPRWELVQQLIEYKKFKEAAGKLSAVIAEAQAIIGRRHTLSHEERTSIPLQPSSKMELWNTFNQVLRRLSDKLTVGQIEAETVTVSERMEYILERLSHQPEFLLSELLEGGPHSVAFVVSTFLALLELTRLKRVILEQDAAFTDIRCLARNDGEALFANEPSLEDQERGQEQLDFQE